MSPTTRDRLNTRVLAEGLAFPEGPIAMADGAVLVVELRGRRLMRAARRRQESIGAMPGSALAIARW